MKRIISLFCVLSIVLTLFSGCSDDKGKAKKYNNGAVECIESGIVAQNDLFELSWNNDGKFISLYDKKADKHWSTTPYEYHLAGGSSKNVRAPISITVANAATAQWETLSGYTAAVEQGRIETEKIENGLEVTYYFDKYSISIPVCYVLGEKGLAVSVKTSEIVEEGELLLASVSIAPFLCSVANTDSDNSYIFVPSGSGALMYADERAEGTRKYTAELFGTDASRLLPEEPTDEVKAYLPVYGVRSENSGLLAIIDKGAECATVYAEAGNKRTGYSTAYATFYLRGYDVEASDSWMWAWQDLKKISDDLIKTDISVLFAPLSGEQVDYNNMAISYRDYLSVNGLLKESKIEYPDYALNIIGGVTYDTTAMGLPDKDLYVMTTLSQAEKIISELESELSLRAAVLMKGYSDKGIGVGEIGGGFAIGKAFGSDKDYKKLLKLSNADIAFDFDLMRYSKSGSGFSYTWDSAKSATLHTVEKFGIQLPLRAYNEEAYHLLKRSKLNDAADKLKRLADKKDMKAISISSLSSISYSDFDSNRYSVKGEMGKQVRGIFEKLQKAKLSVFASDANSYAAAAGDAVFDVPDDNGDYYSLDRSIPFYQTVFSGLKPMYSKAVNLSENSDKAIMEAVASGVRLGYTLAYNHDSESAFSLDEQLYGVKYSDNKAAIVKQVSSLSEFYDNIAEASIVSYEFIGASLTKTTFSNGTAVYANHSGEPIADENGSLEPYGVKIVY